MLTFIRRFFEPQQLILSEEELEKRLTEFHIQKEKEWLSKAGEYIDSVRENLLLLQNQAEKLARAKIPDENHIEEKIKTIVKSQQAFFIGQIKIFVNQLVFQKDSKEAIKHFIDHFNTELAAFTHKTAKSFAISYHLFYKELEDIKETLKSLDNLHTGLNNLWTENETELSTIINIIGAKKNTVKTLFTEKEELQKKVSLLNSELESEKKTLGGLQHNEKIHLLEKELDSVKKQETEERNKIDSFFLQTKRQWLKLAKLHPEHAKEIDFLLEHQNSSGYAKLYSLFFSAIKNKSFGNEDYGKLLKKIEVWTQEYLLESIKQLEKHRTAKEKVLEQLSPIVQHKNALLTKINKLEKELTFLRPQFTAIEKKMNNTYADKQKISQFATTFFGKEVIIND